MIYYHDPAKTAKLQEAIMRGFIKHTLDSDGIDRYELTPMGQLQWISEKNFNRR